VSEVDVLRWISGLIPPLDLPAVYALSSRDRSFVETLFTVNSHFLFLAYSHGYSLIYSQAIRWMSSVYSQS
jgi:hypothetical protein